MRALENKEELSNRPGVNNLGKDIAEMHDVPRCEARVLRENHSSYHGVAQFDRATLLPPRRGEASRFLGCRMVKGRDSIANFLQEYVKGLCQR